MITMSRLKQILLLSLPIIGGMISQNILNLADTAMVGVLGPTALAAVGIASFAVFMSQAMVLGLSSGVQAIAARRVGEGEIDKAGVSLYSGVIIALVLGLLLILMIYPLVPVFFTYLNSDLGVQELGSSYWQIRLLAMVFMGINYSFRGYFNGISQPKYYMFSLLVIHSLNIFMNYVFIYGHFGFEAMGTDGAALASSLATVAGTLMYFSLSFFGLKELKLFRLKPIKADLLSVFKLTIPSGVQQLLIAVGISSLFWMVGFLGVTEVAALNILITILMLCILPGFGFGMAAATLVGTSLGEQEKAKAKRWAYDVVKVGGFITMMLGVILASSAEWILNLFTQDMATIEAALLPLQVTGGIIFIDVMGVILMNALLGSGDVNIVVKTSIFSQWLVFFPLGLISISFFQPNLLWVWLLFSFSRLGQGFVYAHHWQQEKWGAAKI